MTTPPTIELKYSAKNGDTIHFTFNHELNTSLDRISKFVQEVSLELQTILDRRHELTPK